MRNEKYKDSYERTAQKTVGAVMDSPEMKEKIRVAGFRRGFNSLSASTKKVIELGYERFLELPEVPERVIPETANQS